MTKALPIDLLARWRIVGWAWTTSSSRTARVEIHRLHNHDGELVRSLEIENALLRGVAHVFLVVE